MRSFQELDSFSDKSLKRALNAKVDLGIGLPLAICEVVGRGTAKDTQCCIQGTVSSFIDGERKRKLLNEDVGRGYVQGHVDVCICASLQLS